MDTNNNNYEDVYNTRRHAIKDFYDDSTILVTGGTGFLGKVLIEKILRTCLNVQCIYILLRTKKGLSSDQRHAELIQNPVGHLLNASIVYETDRVFLFSLINRFLIRFARKNRSSYEN